MDRPLNAVRIPNWPIVPAQTIIQQHGILGKAVRDKTAANYRASVSGQEILTSYPLFDIHNKKEHSTPIHGIKMLCP